ncbi:DUF2170 family protein [Lysobacter pythonis]|uniref:DUF2170 family protein n=1 Tax=Solilutibacter pythonis TaxID=2483112 RepID=A0A3M2HTJ6_9GAMM|nr:YjfI family protein [Lysobacter pythonis]RMH91143.1 DUF2170 family protein [Lysobacter pythonis]
MKASRTPSPSTLHQRAYRERMRQAGLVKKDVWIRPEYAGELTAIEKRMRESGPETAAPGPWTDDGNRWSLSSIHHALGQTSAAGDGLIGLEWVAGLDPGLHLTLHEYGGLSMFIAIGGEQVIAECWLWPLSAVADPAAFNAHVLATHKLLPLSAVGIETVGGVAGYTMFGALDVRSSLASLMFEIEALAGNVIEASEAWLGYLKPEHAAGDAS